MSDLTRPTTNGWAIAGFIVGLLALIGGFVLFFYAGLILGVFGIALSADGIRRSLKSTQGRGFAIAGLVLSVLAVAFGVFRLLLLSQSS